MFLHQQYKLVLIKSRWVFIHSTIFSYSLSIKVNGFKTVRMVYWYTLGSILCAMLVTVTIWLLVLSSCGLMLNERWMIVSCGWKLHAWLCHVVSWLTSPGLYGTVIDHWPVPRGRDRLLSWWLPLLAECPLTARTYEDGALLRDRAAVHSLSRILHTLNEFTITLEAALVKGVDLWPNR